MEQLALTIPEACAAARVGKTVLYQAISSGALRARKRGRRTLVLPVDLREWVERLPKVEAKPIDRAKPTDRTESKIDRQSRR
jgi:excisionase family DNA binding protein